MAHLLVRKAKFKSPVDNVVRFGFRKENYSNITMEKICEQITIHSGVPAGVVRAAILAINDSISTFLVNGHSVQIVDFVTLRPVANTEGLPIKSRDFPIVKGFNIRATWGSAIKSLQDPNNYTFEDAGAPSNKRGMLLYPSWIPDIALNARVKYKIIGYTPIKDWDHVVKNILENVNNVIDITWAQGKVKDEIIITANNPGPFKFQILDTGGAQPIVLGTYEGFVYAV